MKRFVLLLPLLVFAAAMTGCVSAPPPGALAGGPVYHGYYGNGYYNETPPGTYYGPNVDSGPYYGGGSVAVIRTDVRNNRIYREREQYSRNGRRYYRSGHREYSAQNIAARRQRGNERNSVQVSRPGAGRSRGAVVKPNNRRQPNRRPVPAHQN